MCVCVGGWVGEGGYGGITSSTADSLYCMYVLKYTYFQIRKFRG